MHRGALVGDDRYICTTDRLVHAGQVAGNICRNRCHVVNKPLRNPRGLGDTIHRITHSIGIDSLLGCGGCKSRREWLNRHFPYAANKVPEDMHCGEEASDYTGPVVRNLMMHIYPVREHQFWRWNVDQIIQRLEIFNGVRAIAVVTDDSTNSVEDVQRAFGDARIDYWFGENNIEQLREVRTWHALMLACYTCDPNAITFTCHAKGIRGGRSYEDPGIDRMNPTSLWVSAMYESCLDGHAIAEELLRTHTFAGSFKRRMTIEDTQYRSSWHYAGTFYWYRNARLCSMPNWHQIEAIWDGAETYPGTKVGWGQAGCIFGERIGSLYEEQEWERLWPQYLAWREKHLSK